MILQLLTQTVGTTAHTCKGEVDQPNITIQHNRAHTKLALTNMIGVKQIIIHISCLFLRDSDKTNTSV